MLPAYVQAVFNVSVTAKRVSGFLNYMVENKFLPNRGVVLNAKYKLPQVVSALSANLLATSAFGITVVANRKQNQISLLLNRWEETETEIDLLKAMRRFQVFLTNKFGLSIIDVLLFNFPIRNRK